jgi:hypothetical protein
VTGGRLPPATSHAAAHPTLSHTNIHNDLFPQVAATLRAHGEGHFSEPPPTADGAAAASAVSDFAPGTLQVFGGRYCLHSVDPVQGDRDRLAAVLCFASEPGMVNSPAVQQMFWGRTVSVGSGTDSMAQR